MKATRDAFGEQLVVSARTNDKIVAVSADLGRATKLSLFKDEFPDRFIEAGIAENNMIGISSGLSEHGYRVFLASFASFLTGKYDTIRCSIAYSNAPVVMVGSHGGLAIGKDGVTQMGLEDISLMRSLPGVVILNPATPIECREIVKYLCGEKLNHPHYLRVGRQPVEEVFDDSYKFNIERAVYVRKGTKRSAIFTTGCVLQDALRVANDLDFHLIHFPVIKKIDRWWSIILPLRNNLFDNIFTVEDHSIIGGLGSSVAEIMAENPSRAKLTRIGVDDIFPESGAPDDLYERYGLSYEAMKRLMQ